MRSDVQHGDATPLPPADDQPAPSLRRYSVIGAVIAWIVILACVGIIVAPQFRQTTSETSAAPSWQIDILVRYAVGSQRAVGANAGASALIAQLDASAQHPLDSLKVAALSGELEGAESLHRRLENSQWTDIESEIADVLRLAYTTEKPALDSTQLKLLDEYLGWTSKLVRARGLPPTDPLVAEIDRESRRTFLGLFAYSGSMIVLLVCGLVLLVIGIVLAASGRLAWARVPREIPSQPFLEAFAIYLAGFLSLSLAIPRIGLTGMHWTFLLTIMLPVAVFWCRLRRISWSEIRSAIGWHSGKGLFQETGNGMIGWVTSLPIVALGLLISALLMRFTNSTADHPLTGEVGRQSFWMLFLLASVWAPIFEETMFRGFLFHALRVRWSWIVSAIITGAIFAAIHPQGWTFIPTLGAIGFALAAIRQWRGSLIAPIVCHALVNSVTLTLLWVING